MEILSMLIHGVNQKEVVVFEGERKVLLKKRS